MSNYILILHECQLLGKFQWYEPQGFDPKKRSLDPTKDNFCLSTNEDSIYMLTLQSQKKRNTLAYEEVCLFEETQSFLSYLFGFKTLALFHCLSLYLFRLMGFIQVSMRRVVGTHLWNGRIKEMDQMAGVMRMKSRKANSLKIYQ